MPFDVTTLCEKAVEETFVSAGVEASAVELSFVLADDAFVQQLNRTWREIDTPTNVLAFPCAEDEPVGATERLLGDVVIAFQTARDEAAERQIALEHHVAHLLIHGVLHLLGYDHLDDGDAEKMEALEVIALARLGIADPYGENGSGG